MNMHNTGAEPSRFLDDFRRRRNRARHIPLQGGSMAKGYWINVFRKINDPKKVDAYRELAGPYMNSIGAKFLVRGDPVQTYENGLKERVVIIEFPSVEAAIKAHDSPQYQAALKALGDGADRDLRIVPGLE
jgi:uncharacterized protein (DUF1330 family)